MIALDLAFAISQVDPADRLSALRELVNREFLPLAVTPLRAAGPPAQFDAMVTGGEWGGLRVWQIKASPMSAARTPRHVTLPARDDYLLALHINGTATGGQDDRQVTLSPGDLTLFDPTRPYTIAFQGAGTFEHVIFQIPRADLDARMAAGTMTAVRVPAASSAGRLVSPYLRTLARSASDLPPQALIDSGLDLAAGALRAAAGLGGHRDSRRRALIRELRQYALAHLGDPDLSPQATARAAYISVRELHRLFATEGVSFGAWVREERLRRCRDDLARQQQDHRTVADIATRWGFRSAAHFARVFRDRYGVTPVGVRQRADEQCREKHHRSL